MSYDNVRTLLAGFYFDVSASDVNVSCILKVTLCYKSFVSQVNRLILAVVHHLVLQRTTVPGQNLFSPDTAVQVMATLELYTETRPPIPWMGKTRCGRVR